MINIEDAIILNMYIAFMMTLAYRASSEDFEAGQRPEAGCICAKSARELLAIVVKTQCIYYIHADLDMHAERF